MADLEFAPVAPGYERFCPEYYTPTVKRPLESLTRQQKIDVFRSQPRLYLAYAKNCEHDLQLITEVAKKKMPASHLELMLVSTDTINQSLCWEMINIHGDYLVAFSSSLWNTPGYVDTALNNGLGDRRILQKDPPLTPKQLCKAIVNGMPYADPANAEMEFIESSFPARYVELVAHDPVAKMSRILYCEKPSMSDIEYYNTNPVMVLTARPELYFWFNAENRKKYEGRAVAAHPANLFITKRHQNISLRAILDLFGEGPSERLDPCLVKNSGLRNFALNRRVVKGYKEVKRLSNYVNTSQPLRLKFGQSGNELWGYAKILATDPYFIKELPHIFSHAPDELCTEEVAVACLRHPDCDKSCTSAITSRLLELPAARLVPMLPQITRTGAGCWRLLSKLRVDLAPPMQQIHDDAFITSLLTAEAENDYNSGITDILNNSASRKEHSVPWQKILDSGYVPVNLSKKDPWMFCDTCAMKSFVEKWPNMINIATGSARSNVNLHVEAIRAAGAGGCSVYEIIRQKMQSKRSVANYMLKTFPEYCDLHNIRR
jgi:hypothetical protein